MIDNAAILLQNPVWGFRVLFDANGAVFNVNHVNQYPDHLVSFMLYLSYHKEYRDFILYCNICRYTYTYDYRDKNVDLMGVR